MPFVDSFKVHLNDGFKARTKYLHRCFFATLRCADTFDANQINKAARADKMVTQKSTSLCHRTTRCFSMQERAIGVNRGLNEPFLMKQGKSREEQWREIKDPVMSQNRK